MQYSQEFYENNLKGYKDPETYDKENKWAEDDDFYLALAKKSKGKVLDLACGTGRLTIEIHNQGIDVTGLDIMPQMLERARTKSKGADIKWIEGDCRNFELEDTFDLMLMTSHGFQYLLTDHDQIDFLKSAYTHLNENGQLAFETRNLAHKSYGSHSEFKYCGSIVNDKNESIKAYLYSIYDENTKLDRIFFKTENEITKEIKYSEEYLRYTSQEELNERLKRCGFKVIHQYGNWNKDEFRTDSTEIITICEKI